MSQIADPPLSKATKVARLQQACNPGSSSSQRALLLSALNLCSYAHFFISHFHRFPLLISHFFVARSWFYPEEEVHALFYGSQGWTSNFHFLNSKLQVGVIGCLRAYTCGCMLHCMLLWTTWQLFFIGRSRQTGKRHTRRIHRSRRIGVSTCMPLRPLIYSNSQCTHTGEREHTLLRFVHTCIAGETVLYSHYSSPIPKVPN